MNGSPWKSRLAGSRRLLLLRFPAARCSGKGRFPFFAAAGPLGENGQLGLAPTEIRFHALQDILHAVLRVAPHGGIVSFGIAADQHFGQFGMPALRRLLVPQRGVVQPVEDEHLILFHDLAKSLASSAFGHPHVKPHVEFVNLEHPFATGITVGRDQRVEPVQLLCHAPDFLALGRTGLLGEDSGHL